MKKISKYLTIAAVIALLGVVFYNKVYIPKTTYKTIFAQRGAMDVKVFGIGNVGAKNIYKVSAGVNAKVLSLLSDEGMWVKQGELLAKLDSVDLPIQLQEAKIGVKKAKSELIALQKELKSLEAQKNLAQVTYKRYAKLKSQSFASDSEYDKAEADLQVIEAQMQATKAHLASSKTEIKRAQKSVEALQERLSRYNVYAPVDGFIISKDVQEAQSVGATQTLFQIVKKEDVWIEAYIDERISGVVKVGDKAIISLRSKRDEHYDAHVKRIAPQSDAVTQEREVDVVFENLPIPFYMHEQAEIEIVVEHLENIVKIPANAIAHKGSLSGVWVKHNNTAHFYELELMALSGGEAALKNFDTNMEILLAGEKNKPLSEGMKVH